jgi:hypothetical protein
VVGASAKRQRLISWVRKYPLIAISVLAVAYLLGGFSQSDDSLIPKSVVTTFLYLFVGLVPLGFIIAFIWVGRLGDIEKEQGRTSKTFGYNDPFDLPSEVMHGYKLALITGRNPTLTGLTGDRYLADAAAKCSVNKEHIPPVADCECGFYAYKELADAQFELSINPGAFLLDVDLFGIGFTYQGGYRAESQVVNYLAIPKRCMRCRILPVKVFVTSYKLGFEDNSWWQWQIRCGLCSSSFKAEDKLSIEQMARQLSVAII